MDNPEKLAALGNFVKNCVFSYSSIFFNRIVISGIVLQLDFTGFWLFSLTGTYRILMFSIVPLICIYQILFLLSFCPQLVFFLYLTEF
jgi:hypothetical protein